MASTGVPQARLRRLSAGRRVANLVSAREIFQVSESPRVSPCNVRRAAVARFSCLFFSYVLSSVPTIQHLHLILYANPFNICRNVGFLIVVNLHRQTKNSSSRLYSLRVRQIDGVCLIAEYQSEPLHRQRWRIEIELAPLVPPLAVARLVLLAASRFGLDTLDPEDLVLGLVAVLAQARSRLDDVVENRRTLHAQGQL